MPLARISLDQKYYQIDICCDLQASANITDESCENENDGEISIDITGSSSYNILSNGTILYNGVGQGNYSIQNPSRWYIYHLHN